MLDNNLKQWLYGKIELQEYTVPCEYSLYKIQGEGSVEGEYSYEAEFICDTEIAINELNDTKAKLTFTDSDNTSVEKEVYGLIYEAKEFGTIADKRLYKVRIVSPLYYLGLNKHYEVFMDKSVSEIVQTIILRYAGLLHLDINIKIDAKSSPQRHYTTQYAQSDLEFIKMLIQEEGFVLLLDESSNAPFKITLCELNEHTQELKEQVKCSYNKEKSFLVSQQLQDYYDRAKPSLDYTVNNDHPVSDPSFEDKGVTKQLRQEFKKQTLRDRLDDAFPKDLKRYVTVDSQREYSNSLKITGKTKDLHIKEGVAATLFNPKIHATQDVIITKVKYDGFFPNALSEHVEDADKQSTQYEVEFEAIAKEIIFRPACTIKKPRISGVQTAIVSQGDKDTPGGEDLIDVNEKGEIRVIFHFDQNRPTSCYIPLSTIYAGNNWGAQFLPRVNTEVIVSFINGDLDKPIITGALYNGENAIPYALPAEKTKSYIKTQSTPSAGGYNELLFEDKAGGELLSLRAQKDYKLHALHDSTINIDNDQSETVGHDETVSIGNNRTESVGNDETISIGNSRTEDVGNNETISIGNNQSISIGSNQNVSIGSSATLSVGNSSAETVAIAKALTIGAGYQVSVGGAKNETTGLSSTEQVGILKHIIAGKRFELQVGSSSLILNSDGTIILQGKEIKIDGSKQVKVNGKMIDLN
ncbi:type VI secretion system Vgr family protein [Sulfurimonas sp.]|uniref:type VI secretion system Vgr family protein n=1 Tax=Sulfurimonas sp. TaxID=2022749 RepID=UPI003D0B706E